MRLLTVVLVSVIAINASGGVDPFADLATVTSPVPAAVSTINVSGWFGPNFSYRSELFGLMAWSRNGGDDGHIYSRQSVGGEALKKWSSSTATLAAFDIQARVVRRDNFIATQADAAGDDMDNWSFEIHNMYFDFYNVLDGFLPADLHGAAAGHYNIRVGRFYLPLGINLQTDTHASLLQLSNERNLGFERDWLTGLWGTINRNVNYDLYYLLGSGHEVTSHGQSGLAGARISLGNRLLNDYGLEGGVAALGGERISSHAIMRSPSVAGASRGDDIVQTTRLGIDGRYGRSIPTGRLTFTTEITTGRDENDEIFTQLYQIDYLHHSRRAGLAGQYRRFWQNIGTDDGTGEIDATVSIEATWYFRNDPAGSKLHWIKANIERYTERQATGDDNTILSFQYYVYF